MAELFWRFKVKRRARKILLALPDLPADIDDNVFIALGTQAAEADKNSKAYDEFLFSEEGYEQMPYEDSVQEILSLQQARTPERRGRAELPHRMMIEYIEKLIEVNKRNVADAAAERDAIRQQLLDESEILTGQKKGEDGGFWEGVAPDTTSRTKHITGVIKEWGTLVLVAAADALVVFLSLRTVTSNQEEALMLSAPAIGVQILFPHLVGKALADAKSKNARSIKDWSIAGVVLLAWAGYVYGMTVLRFNLMLDFYVTRYQKPMPDDIQIAVFIFSLLILVGLGLWILIRSMNSNPHKGRYSRLLFVYFNKLRALRVAEARLQKTEADLEASRKQLEVISEQWDRRAASYQQVGESAKSVYRRALVNQQGAPEFTTQYLPESKFKIKRAKKQTND
ncbi:MAG: hypothetical protein EBU12_08010 [Microbacteriaceae bacterium]|nr:hypothetical protein [Microbacteriaceae bacterium]